MVIARDVFIIDIISFLINSCGITFDKHCASAKLLSLLESDRTFSDVERHSDARGEQLGELLICRVHVELRGATSRSTR